MKTPRQKALKKNMISGLILLALSIASLVVGIILDQNQNENLPLFVILFVILIIVTISILTSERTRIKRIYCKYCGEKYNYEEDVDYNTSSYNTSSSSNSAKRVADVRFTCHCSNCGKNTQFTKKFTVATIDKDGNLKEYDQYELAGKYFK